MFEEIVGKVIDEFTTEIDKEKAEESIKSFVSELDNLADFTIKNIAEQMMWDKFRELDTGDNMEEAALEDANYYAREVKEREILQFRISRERVN